MIRKRKNLFNFINDIPLNFKFIMIYIVCVFIPILAINFVFWNKISNDMKEREMENLNISFNRVVTDISAMFTGCVDVSHSVSSDKVLYEKMKTNFKSYNDYYKVYNDLLRDRINRYLPIYNDVKQISLYTSDNTIDSGGNYYFLSQSVRNSLWYKKLRKDGNPICLFEYTDKNDDTGGEYVQYLSILRKLNEFKTDNSDNEQVLKIDIDINSLYSMFDRERDYLSLYLTDPRGNIVCSTDRRYETDASKGYVKFSDVYNKASNNIFFKCRVGTAQYLDGWNIIGIANRKPILRESEQSNRYIIGIIFIVTLISSLLIWIIVRSYNYRVKKLLKHMKKVGNQKFDLIKIDEGKDEIGELISNFNMMTSKINTLINDVYKLQLKKKDLELQRVQAELKFLQSQVDPHFLFNTLNAVMAICVKNKYTELTEVIKYLSKIFRRLISWKDDLVTIKEEISFIEMYLKIEKFRFLEKFDYQIQVDEETFDLKVPKMSIQTLVENACKHGIQNSAEVGIVQIRVTKKEEFLYVDIEDNGSGIEEDRVNEIMEALTEEDEPCENVGIINVYKRLHLYYGDEVEFDLKSEINKGTIVHYGVNINAINRYTERKID